MKNNQRKNKKSLVLVAMILMIGLVAGMGAMTYSRYISTGSSSATATAAKWGFVVNANATDILGTDYTKTSGTLATKVATGSGLSVRSDAEKLIVAPGTTGSMTVSVDGYSEVVAEFSMQIAATEEIKFDTYLPIKWTLSKSTDGGATYSPIGTTYDDIDALNTAMDSETATATWEDAKGFTFGSVTYKITWTWEFNESENDISMKDTLIGYAAAGADWADIENVRGATGKTFAEYTTEAKYLAIVPSMTFSLNVTVAQIQK